VNVPSLSSGRRGLHGQIVQELGHMIVAGDLAVGELLVPEAIAERYGVSRTVVRETLRVLEAKGLISARPNVGTRVRPVADWNLLDPDVIMWRAHAPNDLRRQLRELLELRGAIEPLAARLAARNVSADGRAVLAAAYGSMRAAADAQDFSAFTKADVQFHGALLAASGNGMLDRLSAVVAAALRARGDLFPLAREVSPEALALHGQLLDAVGAGDEDAAEQIMRGLLREADHNIADTLGEANNGGAR